MAKTKTKKSSKSGKDSRPKYRGVKLYAGQKVKIGQIIIRQKGTKFLAGKNVKIGRDFTLYAAKNGVINFNTKRIRSFDNTQRKIKVVSVLEG